MKKLLTLIFLSIALIGITQNLPPKIRSTDKKTKYLTSVERIQQPATVTPCAGGNVSIPSNISGSNYQWQVNSGSGFSNINNGGIYSNATTNTLQITGAPSSLYGYEYRCFVNGNYSAVYVLKFITTWTGASDNAWENQSNWNCNAVPDANTDVIINSGIPFLSTSLSVRTVTLDGGANVTVKTGAHLTVVLKDTTGRASKVIKFMLMWGDSNSGGLALNSDATAQEVASRPEVQIHNNNTGVFENLDIGTNNKLGHAEGNQTDEHGWELKLANLAAANEIANPFYLVKAGWGGAETVNIIQGGNFHGLYNCWGLMTARVDSAIVKTASNKFAVFLSIGGNDQLSQNPVPTATTKANIITALTDLRARYGNVPVVMLKMLSSIPNYTIINADIENICANNPYTFFVEVQDLPLRDLYHPDYAGMKTLCNRMVNKLKDNGYIL